MKSPVLGVLMLDTANPFDVPGCLACDDTFSFPVKRRVIQGATVDKMTSGCEDLHGPMIEAARALEREGVDAILGDCGFTALFQKDLQESVGVPVFTSSLLFVPLASRIIPKGKRVGILTYRANFLSEAHFQGVGWRSKDIPIAVAGVQNQSAWKLFATPAHPFHREDLERQLMDVCRGLIRDYPDVGAIVFECTVMPPFAHVIQAETGLPVFDITMFASMVAEGFNRKPFTGRRTPAAASIGP